MKIGFDAKRAFYNYSGLGSYSRSVIQGLMKYCPDHNYHLYTPSMHNAYQFLNGSEASANIHTPGNPIYSILKSYWRSMGLPRQIKNDSIDIYHGLSNELPFGIEKSKARSLVTVHDLIFIRFPELYKKFDSNIYNKKFKYSSNIADKIIAVSEQTKYDINYFYGIDEEKIEVVYQNCNPVFYNKVTEEKKEEIKKKYKLPTDYLLTVGTIEERKNQMGMIYAVAFGKVDLPLVIIGKPTKYMEAIQKKINQYQLQKKVLILHDVPTEDLPAIYQLASIFGYPSLFEGFGIPIIEALHSGIPVITSKGGCFHEAGGPDSIYVDSTNTEQLTNAIHNICTDSDLRNNMIQKGYEHAEQFKDDKIAQRISDVYKSII